MNRHWLTNFYWVNEMAKKYRLEINYSEVTKDNFDEATMLRKYELDGGICWLSDNDNKEYRFEGHGGSYKITTESWLSEIKAKVPLEFKEWEYQQDFSVWGSRLFQQEATWNGAIKNDRLKLKEKLRFAEVEFVRAIGSNGTLPQTIEILTSTIEDVFEIVQEVLDDNT